MEELHESQLLDECRQAMHGEIEIPGLGTKLLVTPDLVQPVMELIEKDGWVRTLKPRHVIVCEEYEQALMKTVEGYTGNDGVFGPGVPSREE